MGTDAGIHVDRGIFLDHCNPYLPDVRIKIYGPTVWLFLLFFNLILQISNFMRYNALHFAVTAYLLAPYQKSAQLKYNFFLSTIRQR